MKRLLLKLSLALLFAAYPAASHADLTGEPAQVRERMHAIAQHVASFADRFGVCLLYTSPSPRDLSTSRMPSSA